MQLRRNVRGLIACCCFARRLDHAVTAGPGAARARRDDGSSLIEVIVAVVLLAVISLPVARFIIQTGSSASQSRLRVEATNVAETEIESMQNLASFGNILSGQQTLAPVTVAENGGTKSQVFNVTANYSLQTDSGDTGDSVCTLDDGESLPPEIWNVTVTVSWKNSSGVVEGSVTEGTFLAPEAGGSIPATSGELAVPVVDGNNDPYTATAVPISVVGTYVGPSPQPSIPLGEMVTASGNTGSTGCAVFPNLDPAAGWEYTVCIGTTSTCPAASAYLGVVTRQEQPGIVNGSSATAPAFSEGPIPLTFGTVTVAANITVDPGVSVQVSFVTQCPGPASTNGTCLNLVGGTVPAAAANLPVSVSSKYITGANNTFSFDTHAVPEQITSVTLYPETDYTCWAGDTPDSSPTYSPAGSPIYSGASPTPCATNVSSPSAALPVYPVALKATFSGSAPTPTATEYLGPNETIALNALSGAPNSYSYTGLPLGEYQLGYEASGSSSNTPISDWIWVTPSGVYSSSSAFTSGPSGTLASPGAAISVTL